MSAAIRPGPGGSGSVTDITAADITDSTATGRSVLTGTAAEGRAALLERETYDFSSSSGWTLTPGSGGAAITGGVVRLTMPSATTSGDAGRASVTRDISSLVDPSHFRARLRIVSNTNGSSTSFFGMHLSSANLINEIRFTVKTSGALELGFLGTGWGVRASAGGGSIGWDGTWWIELEVDGLTINCRYGQGTTSDPPADDDPSWRWLYSGNVFSAWAGGRPWNTIGMYLTTFGSAPSNITFEADDLILERTALTR